MPHQFGRLVANQVILNQNELWDVRQWLTRPDFDEAMIRAREGSVYFGEILDLDFQIIASDRYRYPFCEVEGTGRTYWETPGSHLTYQDRVGRSEVDFLVATLGSEVSACL